MKASTLCRLGGGRVTASDPGVPETPEVPPPRRDPPEHEPITPIFPDVPPMQPEPEQPDTEPEPV